MSAGLSVDDMPAVLSALIVNRDLQAGDRRNSLWVVDCILPRIDVIASLIGRRIARSRIVDLKYPLAATVLEPERRLAPHHLEQGTELHEVDAGVVSVNIPDHFATGNGELAHVGGESIKPRHFSVGHQDLLLGEAHLLVGLDLRRMRMPYLRLQRIRAQA